MAKTIKKSHVTLERQTALDALSYAQLYLEMRITQCKAAGQDYINYKVELDEILDAIRQC